jgi:ABC-type sugar transport system permease subunit
MFYFSLTRYSVLDAPEWIGLTNFRRMVTADPLFWTALGNTAYYVGLRVPLHVGLGLALAVLANRSLPRDGAVPDRLLPPHGRAPGGDHRRVGLAP